MSGIFYCYHPNNNNTSNTLPYSLRIIPPPTQTNKTATTTDFGRNNTIMHALRSPPSISLSSADDENCSGEDSISLFFNNVIQSCDISQTCSLSTSTTVPLSKLTIIGDDSNNTSINKNNMNEMLTYSSSKVSPSSACVSKSGFSEVNDDQVVTSSTCTRFEPSPREVRFKDALEGETNIDRRQSRRIRRVLRQRTPTPFAVRQVNINDDHTNSNDQAHNDKVMVVDDNDNDTLRESKSCTDSHTVTFSHTPPSAVVFVADIGECDQSSDEKTEPEKEEGTDEKEDQENDSITMNKTGKESCAQPTCTPRAVSFAAEAQKDSESNGFYRKPTGRRMTKPML